VLVDEAVPRAYRSRLPEPPLAVAPTIDGRPHDANDANTRFRTAVARVLARRHG
jgi:hypothetical protein